MTPTRRQAVQAILDGARAEHAALLAQLSPELRRSLPVDATGLTQAIEHLAGLVGLQESLAREQAEAHRANPAVLHGRVFGRAPLSGDTVVAAFADGARVRAGALARLAAAAGGPQLEQRIATLLARHPPDAQATDEPAEAVLKGAYAAQERAVLDIAGGSRRGGIEACPCSGHNVYLHSCSQPSTRRC